MITCLVGVPYALTPMQIFSAEGREVFRRGCRSIYVRGNTWSHSEPSRQALTADDSPVVRQGESR